MPGQMLYLIGTPGSGKTTLLNAVLDGNAYETVLKPFGHERYAGGVRLGLNRPGGFGGTDALPMNVQPVVVDWLYKTPVNYIVAEGDRLGNAKFVTAAYQAGWCADVLLLDVPEAVADARRRARGSLQNPTWLKGRRTKVDALARLCNAQRLDGTLVPSELAFILRSHPVISGLLNVGSGTF